MTPLEHFIAMLHERGIAHSIVCDACGLHVELKAFGQRMVVTNANPINDPTHTRLVVHIMCPLPEQLMMMLDRMCGKTKDGEEEVAE